MRILILTPKVPWPPRDGGALAMWLPVKALLRKGHEVHILALNTSKHFVDYEQLPVFANLHWHLVFTDTSIRLPKLLFNFIFSSYPYLAERYWTKNLKTELCNLLNKNAFDIVQFEGPYLMNYLPVVQQLSQAKIVFRAHNIESEIWKRQAATEKNIVKRLYLNHLSKRIANFEKQIINTYDGLVPITQRDADAFARMGNKQEFWVMPAGMDFEDVEVKHTVSGVKPFFLGALDWMPNQESLVWFVEQVWPKVFAEFPDLQFNIAGRNAPLWLEKKFQVDGVNYHGEIPDASTYLSDYNVLIAPLFSGSGMRVKIIEAMANAKTVITTNIGAEGIPCVSGENILLANSPAEFLDCIRKLKMAPDDIQVIGNKAHNFAISKYNYMEICDGLIAFYETLISNRV
jgi:glycosyltransferase involved in cell wall biosynthesis